MTRSLDHGSFGPSRPAIVRTGDRASEALRRADVLVHELSGLIDGSLRMLELARRDASSENPLSRRSSIVRNLDAALAAMTHIAEIVRGTGRPGAARPGRSLAAAVVAAADVLRPAARQVGVGIDVDVEHALEGVPPDDVYAVVSNAVRNAIEAIASVGGGGSIHVTARIGRDAAGKSQVLLEVIDDGPGPPPGVPTGRLFEPGFSTKSGGPGIGLALAREVMKELQGDIQLRRRSAAASRPGAIFTARYPLPTPPQDAVTGENTQC
ncbi:MAG: ATP-binding protein [Planctomycetota bacterium]|nr:ATP-binding protein [Planctomycetota bacterium]